ncbi:hypothetical protein [Rhizobium sp. FY34]|uniref:hypothetical protein n=1 Tax=Rhizobium sp. FY34 TaxID=2562309 RepID=UPI0010BF7D69|nr:hypothetical protein [Rhizobium sp. FY34]
MTALKGWLVALSVSDAPDRARLGLPAREVDRALFSICTVLVRAGAKIVYAGNLDPKGLTFSMFRHLAGAYSSGSEAPFIHIVPEPILRGASFVEFNNALREGASVVKTLIHFQNALLLARSVDDGLRIGEGPSRIRLADDEQFRAWLGLVKAVETATAYSSARKAVTGLSNARILLGGKMGLLDNPQDAYLGAMPGIVEEAIFALESGLPCIPLGAFGGASRDVAIALNILPQRMRIPRGAQLPTYDMSLKSVTQLRDRIPAQLRKTLSALADDDRSEAMAYDVARTLNEWIDLR